MERRLLKNSVSVLICLSLLLSCSTFNQVASNKLFQKRKYTKGWYSSVSRSIEDRAQVAQQKSVIVNKEISFSDSTTLVRTTTTATSSTVSASNSLVQKRKERIPSIRSTLLKTEQAESSIPRYIDETTIDPVFKSSKEKTSIYPTSLSENVRFQDPWLSDKVVNILLAIFAILVLLFTGIAPLAVWIANGPGPSLKMSVLLYVAFLFFALIFVMTILYITVYAGGAATVSSIGLAVTFGILTVVTSIVSFFHALVSIIKGF